MAPLTVRRKAKSGEIPSIKIGNRLRFDKQKIDKWLFDKSNRGPIQILVVDDELLVVDLFKKSLNSPEYQVTTILNSSDAIELLNTRKFDLIFLDLLLPVLNGAELFRHIRRVDENIPVVIITGYPDSELMDKAMGCGPFMIIKKPFTESDIIFTINVFMQVILPKV